MSLVPIQIRPHLVQFFFKESDGKEAFYCNKKHKSVMFSPTVSTVGRIIRLLMEKSGTPVKVSNFNLYLTISDTPDNKYSGTFYKQIDGRNSFLKLPEQACEDINDLLDDMFRLTFISYMNGCVENTDDQTVVTAINKFIEKYDLLEFGYSTDTMRQLYYREKKKNRLTARFQIKKATHTLNSNL
jgi:hypothetical protein